MQISKAISADFRKFTQKAVLFLVLLVGLDLIFGIVMGRLQSKIRGGTVGKLEYICHAMKEDIVIMGSSRAAHHYVPEIFLTTTGHSAYNTGIDGNGIILSYGLLGMIGKRYVPSMLVCDVSGFDMYECPEDENNTRYLGKLRPFFHEPDIRSIFKEISYAEYLKNHSHLYRANGSLLDIFNGIINSSMGKGKQGYLPLHKQLKAGATPGIKSTATKSVDKVKLRFLQRFIDLAQNNGISLVFCASPSYSGRISSEFYQPIREICASRQLPFVDFSSETEICTDYTLFQDGTHLNHQGAVKFTEALLARFQAQGLWNWK